MIFALLLGRNPGIWYISSLLRPMFFYPSTGLFLLPLLKTSGPSLRTEYIDDNAAHRNQITKALIFEVIQREKFSLFELHFPILKQSFINPPKSPA